MNDCQKNRIPEGKYTKSDLMNEEKQQDREKRLTITADDFFDLLMEQQEQM